MSVLFFGFLLLSGLPETVMVGYSLFSWPVEQMYSQAMPAGIGVWDAVMSWRKESWRRKPSSSFGDGAKEEEETIAGFQL